MTTFLAICCASSAIPLMLLVAINMFDGFDQEDAFSIGRFHVTVFKLMATLAIVCGTSAVVLLFKDAP